MPVALVGLLGYAAILAAVLASGELALIAAAGLALVGLGFSAYLTCREVVNIGAIRIWCVASATVVAALAAITVTRLARHEPSVSAARAAR